MKSHQIKALLKKKRYKSLLENNWNPKTVTWKVWLPKIVARDLSVREQWNKKKKKGYYWRSLSGFCGNGALQWLQVWEIFNAIYVT